VVVPAASHCAVGLVVGPTILGTEPSVHTSSALPLGTVR
jgi:hypothetical protein